MAGGCLFGDGGGDSCSLSGARSSFPPAAAATCSAPSLRRNNIRSRLDSRKRIRNRRGHAGDWLRRYKDLPPAEQERALQNDPAFRRLPPARQQILRQRLQHFSSLPPQQQLRMLNRMETWEHLTPEQKQQARQIYGQMRQLPPDRQRMVTTAVRDLRAMPPDQREQVIDSPRFKGNVLRPGAGDDARGHPPASRSGEGGENEPQQ